MCLGRTPPSNCKHTSVQTMQDVLCYFGSICEHASFVELLHAHQWCRGCRHARGTEDTSTPAAKPAALCCRNSWDLAVPANTHTRTRTLACHHTPHADTYLIRQRHNSWRCAQRVLVARRPADQRKRNVQVQRLHTQQCRQDASTQRIVSLASPAPLLPRIFQSTHLLQATLQAAALTKMHRC